MILHILTDSLSSEIPQTAGAFTRSFQFFHTSSFGQLSKPLYNFIYKRVNLNAYQFILYESNFSLSTLIQPIIRLKHRQGNKMFYVRLQLKPILNCTVIYVTIGSSLPNHFMNMFWQEQTQLLLNSRPNPKGN